jgi:hypothetical protein
MNKLGHTFVLPATSAPCILHVSRPSTTLNESPKTGVVAIASSPMTTPTVLEVKTVEEAIPHVRSGKVQIVTLSTNRDFGKCISTAAAFLKICEEAGIRVLDLECGREVSFLEYVFMSYSSRRRRPARRPSSAPSKT